jgi:hypothetical protein
MTDQEITVGAHAYRWQRLPTLTALEVTRRYSSVIGFVSDVRKKLIEALKDPESERSKLKLGPPSDREMGHAMLVAAAMLPAPDQNFVVQTCLGSLRRIANGAAVMLTEPASGRLMVDDLSPGDVSELVFAVMDRNGLVDFFDAPAPASNGKLPAQQ